MFYVLLSCCGGDNNMFGDNLRNLRKSNGYSMDKLADLYNEKFGGKLNKSTISRYENGLQEPIFTVVKNFSELFNVTTDYLTGNDNITKFSSENPENSELEEYLEELRTRPEMKMLFSVTKNATKEDVERAVKIIEALLKD